jgi:hypothetical protein
VLQDCNVYDVTGVVTSLDKLEIQQETKGTKLGKGGREKLWGNKIRP